MDFLRRRVTVLRRPSSSLGAHLGAPWLRLAAAPNTGRGGAAPDHGLAVARRDMAATRRWPEIQRGECLERVDAPRVVALAAGFRAGLARFQWRFACSLSLDCQEPAMPERGMQHFTH